MADPIVDFYKQWKRREVADGARGRLAVRGVDPNVPADPATARQHALSPWERALLAASDAIKGDPISAPGNDPALAFSPYAGLVEPSKRPQPSRKVGVNDLHRMSPYAGMAQPSLPVEADHPAANEPTPWKRALLSASRLAPQPSGNVAMPKVGTGGDAAAEALPSAIQTTPERAPWRFTKDEAARWTDIAAATKENYTWLQSIPPQRVLPAHLKNARSVTLATLRPEYLAGMEDLPGMLYGAVLDEKKGLEQTPGKPWSRPNTVLMRPDKPMDTFTLYHEVGHSAFNAGDLPQSVQDAWYARHEALLAPGRAMEQHQEALRKQGEIEESKLPERYSEADETRVGDYFNLADEMDDSINKTIPLWLRLGTHGNRRYEDMEGETFAQAFSLYIVAPSFLKSTDPSTYMWMNKHVFNGQEYIRRRDQ